MAWYTVYVIELSDEASLGPKPDASKPYLYVGITKLPPEARFLKHKSGGSTATARVTRYGVRLRPDLVAAYPRANGEASAKVLEQEVANALRAKGYVVDSGKAGMGWDRFRGR